VKVECQRCFVAISANRRDRCGEKNRCVRPTIIGFSLRPKLLVFFCDRVPTQLLIPLNSCNLSFPSKEFESTDIRCSLSLRSTTHISSHTSSLQSFSFLADTRSGECWIVVLGTSLIGAELILFSYFGSSDQFASVLFPTSSVERYIFGGASCRSTTTVCSSNRL
jgi:hypothetical protein